MNVVIIQFREEIKKNSLKNLDLNNQKNKNILFFAEEKDRLSSQKSPTRCNKKCQKTSHRHFARIANSRTTTRKHNGKIATSPK